MDWTFCMSCNLSWRKFLDELKMAFPKGWKFRTFTDTVDIEYDGFLCRYFIEEEEDQDNFYNVLKENYGFTCTHLCRLHTIFNYSGDYLLDMMKMVGTLLKRIPGDAFLMFMGKNQSYTGTMDRFV